MIMTTTISTSGNSQSQYQDNRQRRQQPLSPSATNIIFLRANTKANSTILAILLTLIILVVYNSIYESVRIDITSWTVTPAIIDIPSSTILDPTRNNTSTSLRNNSLDVYAHQNWQHQRQQSSDREKTGNLLQYQHTRNGTETKQLLMNNVSQKKRISENNRDVNPYLAKKIGKRIDQNNDKDNNYSDGPYSNNPDAFAKYMKKEGPWNKKNTWSLISYQEYYNTIKLAHIDLQPRVNEVYTDCIILLLPTNNVSTNDSSNTNIVDDEVKQSKSVQLKFQCNVSTAETSSDNNFDEKIQDEPCTTVNFCLVLPQIKAWERINDIRHPPYNDINFQVDYSIPSYNDSKSAILMMVDGLQYLHRDAVWMSLLNQASYTWQSQRPFFLWIGNVDSQYLNQRHSPIFDAPCLPKESYNTMHYYKPIAFATLFYKQQLVPKINTALFLDADAAFNQIAFESINGKAKKNQKTVGQIIGPEHFFELSTQASLFGWQNTQGGNVMNGGLLGIKNTTWTHDFSALWWYTRCGHKDQRGLWLLLFATWSAMTEIIDTNTTTFNSHNQQFSFPASIFGSYEFCNKIALSILVQQVKRIHSIWNIKASNQDSYSITSSPVPQPTNLTLYRGGEFLNNFRARATVPLEMPHVMIMPLTIWRHYYPINDDTASSPFIDLPGLKADIRKGSDPFIFHSKSNSQVCQNNKCWPFVISNR